MMIFKQNNFEAYVWVWLPAQTKPIVAGKMILENGRYTFFYGKSYRENARAIPLSPFELPLIAGEQYPTGMNTMHSVLRDAAPDAWGRRLVEQYYPELHPNECDYLLLSGSNRIGALDFQASATEYQPREFTEISLEDIACFADQFEAGDHFSSHLAPVLLHGTSIGGARPKSLMTIDNKPYIAKFSLSIDYYPIIKAEFIAMKLAKLCGLNVAEVTLESIMGRDILLVQRFDRVEFMHGYQRKLMLSGLSLLGLNEMEARYASYQDFADIIRHHFFEPEQNLRELYVRIVFNILVGNTDDHARNHAAFWDGRHLTLTPAYDLCPQQRVGQEASQAMMLDGEEGNLATITNVISIAERFLLSTAEAKSIIQSQISVITDHWAELCALAKLSKRDQSLLWGTTVLSEYSGAKRQFC